MRRVPTIALLLALSGCGLGEGEGGRDPGVRAGGKPQSWPRYRSEPCGFEVSLPFARSPDPPPTGAVDLIATESRAHKTAFIVMCSPVMPGPDALGRNVDAIAEALGGSVVERSATAVAGHGAVQLRLAIADRPGAPWSGPVDYHLRVFIAGDLLYAQHAMHASDYDGRADVETFFASLVLQ